MEPPAAMTTAGIYCKACGYDLRASGEAQRCPECGRAFAPGDPKSFRPRPFAAPWKRALGRWARRAAILLLLLVVLLAGTWGWYYRGWRQEQTALAEVGCTRGPWRPVILGGTPGWWLCVRRVPGSFVLERVVRVDLPATATDAALRALRKLEQLEVLTVAGPISDAGMASLGRRPRLRELRVCSPRVTDAGLAALRDLPELEILLLNETALTDAGLVHLTSLGKLRILVLSDTSITDAGLVHLARFPTLESLFLTGTRVTPTGVAKLRAALPGCSILGP